MARRTLNLVTSVILILAVAVLTPERAEADASIVDRQLVSKQRVGRSFYDYTYTLSLAVNGPALDDVRVLVWCDSAGTEITDNEVVFGNVPGNSTTTSSGAEGTFTLRQNRRIPFDESCLNYNIRFVTLLKISGIATDKPLKNATVTVTNSEPVIDDSGRPVVDNSGRPVVDNTTTTVTADEDGAYEAELTVTSQDDFISLTADGEVGSDQEEATLTSTVGSVGELHTVGEEGSIVVGSGDAGALNITHITTAQDELVRRLNGGVPPTNDAELAALQAQVDGAELLLLATTIKTVIDNPNVELPPGINSTLELIQQDPAVVNAYTEQLQTDFPAEFNDALQQTADDLQLGYTTDELFEGPLHAVIKPQLALGAAAAYIFNFRDDGTSTVQATGTADSGAGRFEFSWLINPQGEIEISLTTPAFIGESFEFRDPPGGQVRVQRFLESLRIVRLANGVATDQVFILGSVRVTFPDDPTIPDEFEVNQPDPDLVYVTFGEDGVIPIDPADIAGDKIAVYYYHQDNNSIGINDPILGADFLTFNADGTGTTQRRGFTFAWSIDAAGAVVVDFPNGDSNRFLLYDDSDIALAIVVGSLATGDTFTITREIVDSDGTVFSDANVANRRYRGVFTIVEDVGFLFDFVFLPNGTGCRFDSQGLTWEITPENVLDTFLYSPFTDPVPFQRRGWEVVRVEPGILGPRYWVIEVLDAENSQLDLNYEYADPVTTPGRLNTFEFVEDLTGQFDPCAAVGGSSSLTTLFDSNNGGVGNMFDITTIDNAIEITAFDVNVDFVVGTDFEITVYATADGFTNGVTSGIPGCTTFCVDVGAWTQVATGTGTAAGVDQPSFVDVPAFILDAGTTTGIWITLSRDGSIVDQFRYTNGSGFEENADIRIDIGAGITAPDATNDNLESVFFDRAWNGTVYYNTR